MKILGEKKELQTKSQPHWGLQPPNQYNALYFEEIAMTPENPGTEAGSEKGDTKDSPRPQPNLIPTNLKSEEKTEAQSPSLGRKNNLTPKPH